MLGQTSKGKIDVRGMLCMTVFKGKSLCTGHAIYDSLERKKKHVWQTALKGQKSCARHVTTAFEGQRQCRACVALNAASQLRTSVHPSKTRATLMTESHSHSGGHNY